jgi:hypothetical protein
VGRGSSVSRPEVCIVIRVTRNWTTNRVGLVEEKAYGFSRELSDVWRIMMYPACLMPTCLAAFSCVSGLDHPHSAASES